MDVINIVKSHLIAHSYDGLYNDDLTCACERADLAPNDCLTESCKSGYKSEHSKHGEWIISKKKNITDDEIDEIISQCF